MKKYYFIIIVFFATNLLYAQYPPETTFNATIAVNALPKPNYLQTINDPEHHVNITRISDPTVFNLPVTAGGLNHQYSKIQAWNADMSKIAIGFRNILNASDYTLIKQLSIPFSGGINDARWSHTDPNKRFFCNGNNLYTIAIDSEQVTLVHTFNTLADAKIGPWEGNISANDKYVVITNQAANKAILYDIELDQELANITFNGTGFDWASITPWSNYIVISNNETGHTEIYDLNFNYLRDLTDSQEHADFAIDTSGNQVYVQVIPLSMTRLDNGQTTDLISSAMVCGNSSFNPNIAGHISGRNLNFPGWAFVSTPQSQPCTNGQGYYTNTEVFAIKLDGSGTIMDYGYSRTSFSNYASEAKATVSPDGTKVIFTSDWNIFGDYDDNVLDYVVEYANPASVKDINLKKITIFPNPSTNNIEIDSVYPELQVAIFNKLGEKITKLTYQKGDKINIDKLSDGIYFLKIATLKSNNYVFKKIIKQ